MANDPHTRAQAFEPTRRFERKKSKMDDSDNSIQSGASLYQRNKDTAYRAARGLPRPTQPKHDVQMTAVPGQLNPEPSPKNVMTSYGVPMLHRGATSGNGSWHMDQTGPEQAQNTKRPAEDDDTSNPDTEMPPPARKRTRAATPAGEAPAGRISKASVEELLPGWAFGHASYIMNRGYWTCKDEARLRKEGWSNVDEAELQRSQVCKNEVWAWTIMKDQFGCTPNDLFRYGLRYVPGGVLGQEMEEKDVNLTDSAFWHNLLAILPHPFWGGDIGLLRVILCIAVQVRIGIRRHEPPAGPPYWARGDSRLGRFTTASGTHLAADAITGNTAPEPGFITWLRQTMPRSQFSEWHTRREVALVCEYMYTVHMWNDAHVREVRRVFEKSRLSQTAGLRNANGSILEQFLFLLTADDVYHVILALNMINDKKASETLQRTGTRPPVLGPDDASVNAAFERYRQDRWAVFQGVNAEDPSQVREMRKWGILAQRREAVIRWRMRVQGEADRLPDVPPYDPNADFQLWSGQTEAQLAVVEGNVMLPDLRRWLLHGEGAGFDEQDRKAIWEVLYASSLFLQKMVLERRRERGLKDDRPVSRGAGALLHPSGLLWWSHKHDKFDAERERDFEHVCTAWGDMTGHQPVNWEPNIKQVRGITMKTRPVRRFKFVPGVGLVFSRTTTVDMPTTEEGCRDLLRSFRTEYLRHAEEEERLRQNSMNQLSELMEARDPDEHLYV